MFKRFRRRPTDNKLLIGWREWCALPQLNLNRVKAKIDTGARTSALHAFDISDFEKQGEKYVRFSVHPHQQNNETLVHCEAKVLDRRHVTSSNGQKEERYVIVTQLCLGKACWEIELTLSNRDPLRFRMLLGREAFKHRVLIDPSESYCQGD
jgi:hypothetical protein